MIVEKAESRLTAAQHSDDSELGKAVSHVARGSGNIHIECLPELHRRRRLSYTSSPDANNSRANCSAMGERIVTGCYGNGPQKIEIQE